MGRARARAGLGRRLLQQNEEHRNKSFKMRGSLDKSLGKLRGGKK